MKKHRILFLAANPSGTDRLALDREARAIQVELERSGFRDSFDFETRWAAEPLDLLRELRKLRPTVVHFSGHGCGHGERGLLFQGPGGRAEVVAPSALAEAFAAAGESVKVVVLNACYSDLEADALLTSVDCVVGMVGSIHADAARSFAVGFYGALGECMSIAAAYAHGKAAIHLEGFSDHQQPQLKVRHGFDAGRLVLAMELASQPDALDALDADVGLPRASSDEILVVIAQFDSSTPDRLHVEERMQRAFSSIRETLPHLPLRVERLRTTTILNGDEVRAEQILRRCNARLLIWGWYDPMGFCPRITADPLATIERMVPELNEVPRDDAVASFRRYITTELSMSIRIWALTIVGELLYWAGRFDDCVDAFDAAIAQWRESPTLRDPLLDGRLATVFFYKGIVTGTRQRKVHVAAECFREVLALKPEACIAAYNLGDALFGLRDFEGAIAAFSHALRIAPEHHAALVGRGHAHFNLGGYRNAVDDYTAALALLTSADVLLARSRAHHELGAERLALGDFLLAKELDPFAELPVDHLGDLAHWYGKDAYERAEFAAITGRAPTGRYAVPAISHFLGTARRFLGRPLPHLGTRGPVVDSEAEYIASLLTSIHRKTGHFMEVSGDEVTQALESASTSFLKSFGQGLRDQECVLRSLITLLRLERRDLRSTLSTLMKVGEVRSRLLHRLRTAIDLLLVQDIEYLHAAAIVGGAPVFWDGDEARRAPLCSMVSAHLQALGRADWVEESSTGMKVIDRRMTIRHEVLNSLIYTLAPPLDRGAQAWIWKDVAELVNAFALSEDRPPFSRELKDLMRLLVEHSLLPPGVRELVVDLLDAAPSSLDLINAIRLHAKQYRWRSVDAAEITEVRAMAAKDDSRQ